PMPHPTSSTRWPGPVAAAATMRSDLGQVNDWSIGPPRPPPPATACHSSRTTSFAIVSAPGHEIGDPGARRQATVHHQRRPRDVRRLVGGEEEDRARHLLAPPEAADGNGRAHPLLA